jgi:uracil-DNA glycosylase
VPLWQEELEEWLFCPNKMFNPMDVKIEESWKQQLQDEFDKPYFKQLTDFVRSEYASQTVYPPAKLIFNAFNQCPFDRVKVVILGQDPYHGPGQAHGLCFSVNNGVEFPPSLRNIFKEIHDDTGAPVPASGNLERWAKQGVLLLNATLTVRAHIAGSHQKKGWEQFTDSVIHLVADRLENVVFILWGNYAISKGEFIDPGKHLILKSVHPSPLSASRGFFGNKQFSATNKYLLEHGKEQIIW